MGERIAVVTDAGMPCISDPGFTLTRALRVDKTTLAGLAATLGHYLKDEAPRAVPVWRMLAAPPDEIAARLSRMTTSSFFALGIALRRWGPLSRRARRAASGHLEDLERLEGLGLDRLHFGVRRLGLLAMDLPGGGEIFAATGHPGPVPPARLVLGGISIPVLYPLVRFESPGRTYRLADGGFSHSVPVERAFQPPFSARRVLATAPGASWSSR